MGVFLSPCTHTHTHAIRPFWGILFEIYRASVRLAWIMIIFTNTQTHTRTFTNSARFISRRLESVRKGNLYYFTESIKNIRNFTTTRRDGGLMFRSPKVFLVGWIGFGEPLLLHVGHGFVAPKRTQCVLHSLWICFCFVWRSDESTGGVSDAMKLVCGCRNSSMIQ